MGRAVPDPLRARRRRRARLVGRRVAAYGGTALAAAIVGLTTHGRGRRSLRYDAYDPAATDPQIGTADFQRLLATVTGSAMSGGGHVELLRNGDEIFPAMLETIRGARRTLNLLTYIYWSGEIAEEVADAVAERARAGVECNVLIDAFGGRHMGEELVSRMSEAGADVRWFRPLRPGVIRRWNNRTHRRVLVVDGEVGLTGGAGIADEWTGNAQDPYHWRDNHVRVRGPVVAALQGAFAENWLEASGETLHGEGHLPRLDPLPGGVPMQAVRSGQSAGASGAELLYLLSARAARRSIRVTASYFTPPPVFCEALSGAARRGVEVTLLVSGPHAESKLVRDAGRTFYGSLLESGVRIFEFQPTTLHAKAVVVDGEWSAMGTANFDSRSFMLNEEAMLCVWGTDFARALADAFAEDVERSEEVTLEDWRRWGPLVRGRNRVARLLAQQL